MQVAGIAFVHTGVCVTEGGGGGVDAQVATITLGMSWRMCISESDIERIDAQVAVAAAPGGGSHCLGMSWLMSDSEGVDSRVEAAAAPPRSVLVDV